MLSSNHMPSSSQKDVPPWDVFECFPPPPESGSMQSNKFFEIVSWILKMFIYGLLFTIVLCSGITSKLAVLLATAQLRKNQSSSCNHSLGKILILEHVQLKNYKHLHSIDGILKVWNFSNLTVLQNF